MTFAAPHDQGAGVPVLGVRPGQLADAVEQVVVGHPSRVGRPPLAYRLAVGRQRQVAPVGGRLAEEHAELRGRASKQGRGGPQAKVVVDALVGEAVDRGEQGAVHQVLHAEIDTAHDAFDHRVEGTVQALLHVQLVEQR